MFLNYIYSILFQHIPESLALAYTSTIFLFEKVFLKKILIIGILNGIIIFFLRLMPVSFGFHTIIFLIVFFVIIKYFYKKNILKSLIAVLKSFILLAVFESIFGYLAVFITGKSVELILSDPFLKSMVMIPQISSLFITGLIVKNYRNKKTDNKVDKNVV